MNIKIAGIENDSIVDGPGIRLTVFTQGCFHNCPGCHNPNTHDPEKGTLYDVSAIEKLLEENPLLDGLTLSGGEPFLQAKACTRLAQYAHRLGLNVWTYTGYTFEDILSSSKEDWKELLEETDVLIDGPFLQDSKSLDLPFRGSKNQRLIDIKQSLACKKLIEYPL